MKRRRYTEQVEVWQGAATFDGYSGNLLVDTLLVKSWANVTTLSGSKLAQIGLDISQLTIKVELRSRNDVDYDTPGLFLKYKTKEFTIISVVDIDMNGNEMEIIAVSG